MRLVFFYLYSYKYTLVNGENEIPEQLMINCHDTPEMSCDEIIADSGCDAVVHTQEGREYNVGIDLCHRSCGCKADWLVQSWLNEEGWYKAWADRKWN